MAFFHARREEGFQLVRKRAALDRLIRAHDLVITGEGSFDGTSLLGKAPTQLAALGKKLKRPVWALCGRVEHKGRSPFARLEGLEPHPKFDSLKPKDHAKRLEDLAFRVAALEDLGW
jgi:glycerate kinase